jgi:glycosyltransferase involved in cell wall biosynthesis
MKQRPTFSIVIPVFNLQNYIAATLESLIAQTFVGWEALVVDDASTDESLLKAQEYAQKDSRIRVICNTRSKGVSGARNTGIDKAEGHWIAFLDGDDLFDPRALEYRALAADKWPDCEFLSGDFLRFDDSSGQKSTQQSIANSAWRRVLYCGATPCDLPSSIEKPLIHFLDQVLTWTGSVTVKTDLLRRLGGFNEDLKTSEDDHLWIRVAASVDRMVFEPRSLTLYRQRPNSLTSSGKALHHDAVSAYTLLLQDSLLRPYRTELKRKIRYFAHQNAFFYRSTKQRRHALWWSIRACGLDPLAIQSWRNLIAALTLQ